jgi:aryl sulfotransferase
MQHHDFPKRTREYVNDTLNSKHWDAVNFRNDDILVCTSLKSGTTWMLRILSLLIHQNPRVDSEVMKTPWPDYRLLASIEEEVKNMDAITHRRFIKTHIPLDGLPYNENIKYIQVTREMHDAFFSLQNHWEILADDNLANKDKYGDKPFPRFKDGGDVHQRWHDWLAKSTFEWEQDGYPFWSMFSYVESFWPYRHLPNILMVHFTDLLEDLEGQMRRVARFIDVEVPEEKWPALVESATFDSMKRDLKTLQPKFDKMFKGGGDAFMDKVDGIWKDILTKEEDHAVYEARASQLDPELREWIEKGSLVVGYPDGKPDVKPVGK